MEGVGTAESIDTVMKLGMNHPIGPLALADLIGLDTCLAILEVMHAGLGDPKYRPCPLLRKYVDAGWLGGRRGGVSTSTRHSMDGLACALCPVRAQAGIFDGSISRLKRLSLDGPHSTHRTAAGDHRVARDFAASELAPHVAQWDRDSHFEPSVVAKLGELGFLGMLLPEEYDGLGLDTLTYLLALEEIAAVDASTAVLLSVHNTFPTQMILRFGTDSAAGSGS